MMRRRGGKDGGEGKGGGGREGGREDSDAPAHFCDPQTCTPSEGDPYGSLHLLIKVSMAGGMHEGSHTKQTDIDEQKRHCTTEK